jgi:hypothetical protein
MLKREMDNYKTVHDFIKGSIDYGVHIWTFPIAPDTVGKKTDKTSDVLVIVKNRVYQLYVTCCASQTENDAENLYKKNGDSNPEDYFSVFDDLLADIIKLKDPIAQMKVRKNFLIHGCLLPIEIMLIRQYVFAADEKKIEKQASKTDKVFEYIKSAGTEGRTGNEITQFIKNYKPELRKEVVELLTENEDIRIVETGEGRKKTTVYFFNRDN